MEKETSLENTFPILWFCLSGLKSTIENTFAQNREFSVSWQIIERCALLLLSSLLRLSHVWQQQIQSSKWIYHNLSVWEQHFKYWRGSALFVSNHAGCYFCDLAAFAAVPAESQTSFVNTLSPMEDLNYLGGSENVNISVPVYRMEFKPTKLTKSVYLKGQLTPDGESWIWIQTFSISVEKVMEISLPPSIAIKCLYCITYKMLLCLGRADVKLEQNSFPTIDEWWPEQSIE